MATPDGWQPQGAKAKGAMAAEGEDNRSGGNTCKSPSLLVSSFSRESDSRSKQKFEYIPWEAAEEDFVYFVDDEFTAALLHYEFSTLVSLSLSYFLFYDISCIPCISVKALADLPYSFTQCALTGRMS